MSSALDIDMYQASMLRAYFLSDMHENKGSMELFARKLPPTRDFFVVAGIARAIDYLYNLKFTDEDIKTLSSIASLEIGSNSKDGQFVNWLSSIDFKKELTLYAFQEGNVAFPHEPLLRIEGPIGLCQFVEKRLLSIMNHDIRIASKAARISLAAMERPIFEFGGRRAHDACSADTARAAYIAGCAGTSNVQAYQKYGVPAIGTMGHVWVMSHENELEAFRNWSKAYNKSIYLIDTYNAFHGVDHAIQAAQNNLGGVRLDSGDLLDQSVQFKRNLENRSFGSKIVASNDLDEYSITALLEKGATIDAFGVGTQLVSTPDTPSLNFVYKLVSVAYQRDGEQHPICKVADGFSGKGTWPGAKQVWRHYTEHFGRLIFTHDTVDLEENLKGDELQRPMLVKHDITNICHQSRTELARQNFIDAANSMPSYMKVIPKEPPIRHRLEYPVKFSERLSTIRREIADKNLKSRFS